jgi:hypothetical protein
MTKNVRSTLRLLATALAMGPLAAGAATITPSTFDATIDVGESVSINKTITLDPIAASRVDIFFLADNTGSMGGIINNVKTVAGSLLSTLASTYSDAQFGVGRYLGDPSEGVTPLTAYLRQQAITANQANVQTAINGWIASGGGDLPEANFFALQQVASDGAAPPGGGAGTGQATGWRAGAQPVVVWFGDATSHTATVDEAEAIAALQARGAVVAALNSIGSGAGIDGNFGGDSNQASDVAAATSGVLINNFASVPVGDVADTIIDAIGEITSTVDLVFNTSTSFAGLGVTFECIDALGCDDVPGGASRDFRVTFTGLAPGTYSFNIFATGVDATEADRIVVTGEPGEVPEPGTLALLGIALAGLGFLRKRG